MMSTITTSAMQTAQEILLKANHLVALTGAGISTASGIPDFRDPSSGLWTQHDPMEVATIQAFQQRPQAFYYWLRPLAVQVLAAEPNAAHQALYDLEHYGPLQSIITQNIDLLHTKAGTQTIREVHGHIREVICLSCQTTDTAADKFEQFMKTGQIPTCAACGQALKPTVVLFGELLPAQAMQQAQADALQCDVMLIIGTSLEVMPVNDLPLHAYRHGAKLIVVNRTPTFIDHYAQVVLRGDATEILPQLAQPFLPVT